MRNRTETAIHVAAETVYEHWRPESNDIGEVVEAILETYGNDPLPFEIQIFDNVVPIMVKYRKAGIDFFEAIKIEKDKLITEFI